MTMEFVVRDYKVKTPKNKSKSMSKCVSSAEPKTTASEGDMNNNAD